MIEGILTIKNIILISVRKMLIIKFKVFIYEKCIICIFFINKNKNLRYKISNPFFGCKFAFVLKYKFYEKKSLHAKFDIFAFIP